MAKKQNKTPIQQAVPQAKTVAQKQQDNVKVPFKLEIPSMPRKLSGLTPYLPGVILFIISVIIGLAVYKDYGISWDEPEQRLHGLQSYNYIFHGNQELFTTVSDHHGMGFELLLVIIEKLFRLSDTRDIYLMRHLFTHIFFLIGALSLYILAYRSFRNKFIACLGFIMLAFASRLYAHSFFNTRDIPFLSMFIITLACCQVAFDKNKPLLFFILGLLCGYTTSIRIMGIMLVGFIILFLFVDLVTKYKEKLQKPILNLLLFSVGFVFTLYIAWPYLWRNTVQNFIESFNAFAHFAIGVNLTFVILFNGHYVMTDRLPWTYFPTWFLITNPEVWLVAGFGGVIWIIIDFFKKPATFLKNSRERNFLLYLMCFIVPVLAVVLLHSVVYNDWRHLYFVYPSFVLIALYFVNKLAQTRYKKIVGGVCAAQIALTGFFMINDHPFQQVYFNNFISHEPGYLKNNYELEYWGCSVKQGIDHLLTTDSNPIIMINCLTNGLIERQVLLLPVDDRKRIQFADFEKADYFLSHLKNDPYANVFSNADYSITTLNSDILNIYKLEKDPAKQLKICEKLIVSAKNAKANDFNDIGTDYIIGSSFYKLGKDDSAIFYLQKVLPHDLSYVQAEKGLGHSYLDKQNYDSAEVYYKKVLEHTPDDADVINNLGVLYLNTKKYQLAIDEFNKGIALTHGNAVAYSNLGRSYYAAGQYNTALENFKKEFTLDSRNKSDYPVIGACWQMLGKKDSANKYQAMAK